jgi:hypothetical protein
VPEGEDDFVVITAAWNNDADEETAEIAAIGDVATIVRNTGFRGDDNAIFKFLCNVVHALSNE